MVPFAKNFFKNFLGAFADGAVLFPILALLSHVPGFDSRILLAGAGLCYMLTAAHFRVPVSVQPLKSIAVAAIAVGATALEIRWAGALLGAACLSLLFIRAQRFSGFVPLAVIRQVQLGLGVLLIIQAVKTLGLFSVEPNLVSFSALGLAVLMIAVPELFGVPVLGILATVGFFYAVFSGGTASTLSPSLASENSFSSLRWPMVFGLVLPQIALTLTNSVLATENVTKHYFGPAANRVTISRLLTSIGIGNLIASLFGGMPFCHGSGGVTAHYRGGARSATSMLWIGLTLVALAAAQWWFQVGAIIYPKVLISALLLTTGFFHLQLGLPKGLVRFQNRIEVIRVLLTMIAVIWTQNLLVVLAIAVLVAIFEKRISNDFVFAGTRTHR